MTKVKVGDCVLIEKKDDSVIVGVLKEIGISFIEIEGSKNTFLIAISHINLIKKKKKDKDA